MNPKDILWLMWFLILTIVPIILTAQNLNPILALFFTPSWGLMLFKILYDRWDGFYFFANRLWLQITKTTISWDFAVEFELDTKSPSLKEIKVAILETFSHSHVRIDTQNQIAITFRGYTLFLSTRKNVGALLIDEDDRNSVLIEISDFKAPFNVAERLLDQEIFPLLEFAKDTILPTHQKYMIKLSLEHGNPYFGLFVRKLNLRQVIQFTCQFSEIIAGKKEMVTVGKEKLTLVTESLTSLQALAHKYLTLSSVS